MFRTSVMRGMDVLHRNICILRSLKSTTGLLSLVSLRVISITLEVWLVLFLERIPSKINCSIWQSMKGLSFSLIGNGHTKKEESSMTFRSALRLGQCPISSLRLNAFLYLTIKAISLLFSHELRRESERSMRSHRI